MTKYYAVKIGDGWDEDYVLYRAEDFKLDDHDERGEVLELNLVAKYKIETKLVPVAVEGAKKRGRPAKK